MSSILSLIRWAGGKGRQLEQLLPYIPDGKIYVEPFGGGGTVLLNRHRTPVEVYNDLDGQLVNLFRVIRSESDFELFRQKLGWTLYAKEGFLDSLECDSEPDEVLKAVKFYTMLNQSLSGKRLAGKNDWARGKEDNLAERWVIRQEKLGAIRDRLQRVQIEHRDALDCIRGWDTPDTVFYCDPPYVLDTRKGQKYYAVEPGDEWHHELVALLQTVQGAVVLSGYLHPTYNVLMEAGWQADSYSQHALMTVHDIGEERDKRMEVVWRNEKARDAGLKVPLPLDWGGGTVDVEMGRVEESGWHYTDDGVLESDVF